MKHGHKAIAVLAAAGISFFPFLSGEAQAQRFDMGGLAGGILGGAIAGAMINSARPQPTIVYRSQPSVVYRSRTVYGARAPRHVAKAQNRNAGNKPQSASASVVDTAADPFAAKASAAVLPVSAKP